MSETEEVRVATSVLSVSLLLAALQFVINEDFLVILLAGVIFGVFSFSCFGNGCACLVRFSFL